MWRALKKWYKFTQTVKTHCITTFTFIHLENNAQTKTMLCLFQNKTCTINFSNKPEVTFQRKYQSDKKLWLLFLWYISETSAALPLTEIWTPYWEVWSAADTALFVAIWHQKHIRVKLNNRLFNKRKWRNGHRVSSDIIATCKLLTFSFELGRVSFLWPRSRAG